MQEACSMAKTTRKYRDPPRAEEPKIMMINFVNAIQSQGQIHTKIM